MIHHDTKNITVSYNHYIKEATFLPSEIADLKTQKKTWEEMGSTLMGLFWVEKSGCPSDIRQDVVTVVVVEETHFEVPSLTCDVGRFFFMFFFLNDVTAV